MRGMFLHFLNRVINPVVVLSTDSALTKFLDSEKEYVEENNSIFKTKFEPIGDYYSRMGKRVRVIGLFHDKKEYKNEIKLLEKAA
jgi:hypothetical protein